MITVDEADAILNHRLLSLHPTNIPISHLSGFETSLNPILADRDSPPYNRVCMDGIALKSSKVQQETRAFAIESYQKAGSPPLTLNNEDRCIEVATGSVLPHGCDSVVPYERLEIKNGRALLEPDIRVAPWDNVHTEGSDHLKNAILCDARTDVSAPIVGIAASTGQCSLQVKKQPRITIISTGDELVDIEATPDNFQIRQSNVYAIKTGLHSFGFTDVKIHHLHDEPKIMIELLGKYLETTDCLIISGGVSKGRFDFVPTVLADLNFSCLFHRVSQRPGKPLWFGQDSQKRAAFGLPGNPISALICARRYVIPYLRSSISSLSANVGVWAKLSEEIVFKRELSYFLPAKLALTPLGELIAAPQKSNGSGDFASLAKSNGFIELPPNRSRFQKGDAFRFYGWRPLL